MEIMQSAQSFNVKADGTYSHSMLQIFKRGVKD
jgi:hypothetical protein